MRTHIVLSMFHAESNNHGPKSLDKFALVALFSYMPNNKQSHANSTTLAPSLPPPTILDMYGKCLKNFSIVFSGLA